MTAYYKLIWPCRSDAVPYGAIQVQLKYFAGPPLALGLSEA